MRGVMDWREEYQSRLTSAEEALKAIQPGDRVVIPIGCNPQLWGDTLAARIDDLAVRGPGPKGSPRLYDRQILREALAGDPALAQQMAEEHWSRPNVDDWSSLEVAAVVGDRERANELAARIDAHPGSAVVLSLAVNICFCGAPFDLEATPNYRARIKEAGFPWPPPKRIDYPTKTW